jgi:hypothetical protein
MICVRCFATDDGFIRFRPFHPFPLESCGGGVLYCTQAILIETATLVFGVREGEFWHEYL